MLLAGGKKPKIHLDVTPKKRTILLWRTLENRIITSFYWESRCLRSFTSGFNCVKKRWRALAISAPFFICTDLLEIYFPFFSFLNTTLATKAAFSRFTNKSICMTFLHQRHFFVIVVCVCAPVALWRRGKACCLGKKMSFRVCDKHFTRSLYTAPGLSHRHSSMLLLSEGILASRSLRCSGYKSIVGNCMQMWPSVKLPISLQFRAVCSFFI